jgi:GNAT superfamily N-acetyltransferase
MCTFRIERLHVGEWDRLRAIRLRALADAPAAFATASAECERLSPEDWRRQLHELPTFVAALDGRDAGMVRNCRDADRPDTAWLLSMWVAPDARRRGVGQCLIAAAVAWARESRFRRMLLEVGDANTAAIALYASMGFVANGRVSTLPPPREHITEHQRELLL